MDKPKGKWSELMNQFSQDLEKLGKGIEQAYKGAADSAAGQKMREVIAEATPQVKKAVETIGPELRKVVDQVRPEMKKVVDQARPAVKGALEELFGKGQAYPSQPSQPSGAPPNISPEAYTTPAPDPDDADTPSDSQQKSAARGPKTRKPGPAKPAAKKTLGRKKSH